MRVISRALKAPGIDDADLKTLAAMFAVVLAAGVALILLALGAGLAVAAFDLAKWT